MGVGGLQLSVTLRRVRGDVRDAYVSRIFGRQYAVIDNIARLPEQLPILFMALTR